MKLQIALIRCAGTNGSLQGRYLGCSNERLQKQEAARLQERVDAGVYPDMKIVYSSALLRCRQTANLIYPRKPAIILDALSAYDLGRYESLQHHTIVQDKQFRTWARSLKLLPLGDGEEPNSCFARSSFAFREIVREIANKKIGQAAVVSHRMILQTILQRFCVPRSYYKEWEIDFGGGYVIEFDTDREVARVIENIM